ncbi:MAG: isoprenylcysteine carboxylmethyltransferase family protein [Alphaproteobacteria bacterium]|nr:isoprenylcysteine carboxylmethyltransferase family protein [Alphaproteobacteria bacterium]
MQTIGGPLGRVVRNGLPAALTAWYTWFVYGAVRWDWSKALLLCQLTLLAVFFAFRRDPVRVSWRLDHLFVALFGTFGPFLLGFFVTVPSRESPVGIGMQAFGLVFALLSLASLNWSFGILPANRGIKTGGLYRVVRHPIYASYQFLHVGYVVNHPTLEAGVIVWCTLFAQVLRIVAEEQVLAEDPAYQAYMERVRYRLLPPFF